MSEITDAMQQKRAFTLVELLVVIAIISILAGLLLPGLGKAKTKGQGIQCLNNHRQLMLAWRMYNEDNADKLLYASSSPFFGDASKDPFVWVLGEIDFDPANSSNWDVDRDIKKSPLWTYCGKSTGIWKCPADHSTIKPSSGPFKAQFLRSHNSIRALEPWLDTCLTPIPALRCCGIIQKSSNGWRPRHPMIVRSRVSRATSFIRALRNVPSQRKSAQKWSSC